MAGLKVNLIGKTRTVSESTENSASFLFYAKNSWDAWFLSNLHSKIQNEFEEENFGFLAAAQQSSGERGHSGLSLGVKGRERRGECSSWTVEGRRGLRV